MKEDKKKVFLRSFGCQMNLRDGEVIVGILQREGFGVADSADAADVVIFVTCAVRQHAEDKVWSEIGRVAKKRLLPLHHTVQGRNDTAPGKKIIGLVGCMAQEHKERAFERSAAVDFVVGPQDIDKIPGIVKKIASSRKTLLAMTQIGKAPGLFERKIWETDGQGRPEEIYHTGYYKDKEHAYVVISEGCSNFCSYCIVPYVRGPLRHRNPEDILKEISLAVDSGRRKITLLGQNVCAYETAYSVEREDSKESSAKFVDLLRMVNGIEELKEFSFITSHPKDTTVELFEAMAECDKLKKFLHLPVQSGSDRILKLMNRGYTKKYYLELARNYRKIVKNGVLTTDVILGFPSETQEDFQETFDLVQEVRFNAAFIFKYSPRQGTTAFNYADDVAREEKERRHKLVLDLQKSISKGKG